MRGQPRGVDEGDPAGPPALDAEGEHGTEEPGMVLVGVITHATHGARLGKGGDVCQLGSIRRRPSHAPRTHTWDAPRAEVALGELVRLVLRQAWVPAQSAVDGCARGIERMWSTFYLPTYLATDAAVSMDIDMDTLCAVHSPRTAPRRPWGGPGATARGAGRCRRCAPPAGRASRGPRG